MVTELSNSTAVLGDRYTPISEFIVYINGVEIPAHEVSVHYGIWQIPQASIVLPPAVDIIGIGREDRLSAAIFYLDQFYSKDGTTIEEPTYRLLFDGEIVGSSYQVTGNMRTITLTAVAHMGIFTQMFPFFIRSINELVAGETGNFHDRIAFTDNPLVSHLWYRGLDGNSKVPIRRPFDFVENLFNAVVSPQQSEQRSSAAQDFFAKWMRMHNFHNRWLPCPYLETQDLGTNDNGIFPILKAVQSNESLAALQNRSQRIGSEGSFWDVFQGIFSTVYYEILQIPAPPVYSVELGTGVILGPAQWAGDEESATYPETDFFTSSKEDGFVKRDDFDPPVKRVISNPDNEPLNPRQPVRIASNLTKPQLPFTVPPFCNVIFPSQTQSKTYNENYATQPTRIYISDPSLIQRLQMDPRNPMTQITLFNTQVAFPREANEAARRLIKKEGGVGQGNPFDTLIWPEEYFKGPVISKTVYPEWFTLLNEAYTSLSRLGTEVPSLSTQPLFELYAANEFYRQRLSQQQGNVSLTFDPYIVPGFPGVFLDSNHPALHFFGYITNVQHRMSQSSSSTTVNYAFGQYFQDFFKTLWEAKFDLMNSQARTDEDALKTLQEDLGDGNLDKVIAAQLEKLQKEIGEISAQVKKAERPTEVAIYYGLLNTPVRVENRAYTTAEIDAIVATVSSRHQETVKKHLQEISERALNHQINLAKSLGKLRDLEEEVNRLPAPDDIKGMAKRIINLVKTSAEEFDYAPVSPFPSIRTRFQNTRNAEQVFSNLFHGQGETLEGPIELGPKPVAFDWKKHLRVTAADRQRQESDPNPVILSSDKEESNVFEHGVWQPLFQAASSLQEPVASMEAALKLKSRPVCTLEEYISFHGDLGVRKGLVPITDDKAGKGAYYYKQIFEYSYFAENEEDPLATAEKREAQIRHNWTERLLEFRRKLINREMDT